MKKVGIVTFNDAINYGAFLQEYALQQVLRKNDIETEVINYTNKEFSQLYKYANNPILRVGLKNKLKILYNIFLRPRTYYARLRKHKKFQNCWDTEIVHSLPFAEHKKEIIEKYDYFISGSDQVWNLRLTDYNYYYLLGFVSENNKKLSYAASFGRTQFDVNDYKIFKDELSTFASVLVREQSGKKILEQCNIKSEVVLDPTLLLNREEWLNFSKKAEYNPNRNKYVLIYVVSKPDNVFEAALSYAKKRNLDVIMLGRSSGITIDGQKIKATVNAGPYEYIDYISNAEAIFTTSYHGTIFSINLRKKFFYELSKEKYNNNARLTDIIASLNITGREIVSNAVEDSEINWNSIHDKLDKQRNQSIKFLLDSIK